MVRRTSRPASGRQPDPEVRGVASYAAAVLASSLSFVALDAIGVALEAAAPSSFENTAPFHWSDPIIAFGFMLLLVGLFALVPFALCLAISVRAGIWHPAFHVACGGVIGLGLGRLFAGMVDRPIPAVLAGAVGGIVFWWMAERRRVRPSTPSPPASRAMGP